MGRPGRPGLDRGLQHGLLRRVRRCGRARGPGKLGLRHPFLRRARVHGRPGPPPPAPPGGGLLVASPPPAPGGAFAARCVAHLQGPDTRRVQDARLVVGVGVAAPGGVGGGAARVGQHGQRGYVFILRILPRPQLFCHLHVLADGWGQGVEACEAKAPKHLVVGNGQGELADGVGTQIVLQQPELQKAVVVPQCLRQQSSTATLDAIRFGVELQYGPVDPDHLRELRGALVPDLVQSDMQLGQGSALFTQALRDVPGPLCTEAATAEV
mmetsp:Transcript_127867/g.347027  ORF Transcript_127867/g.347027 Transcript_127867/m.347027 type:complete len:268 (+) Transcript_127867:776-1579(+)